MPCFVDIQILVRRAIVDLVSRRIVLGLDHRQAYGVKQLAGV
jgi:hypothetical protein